MVVPLYIGEVAHPPRVRGALASFNQLAVTSGILASYLVDYGLASTQNWRLMFGLAAVPAILMFTGMLFQHESPHWLVAQGREDEARKVLHRVRGEGDIDAEIAEVRELSERNSSFREVLRPAVRHVMARQAGGDLLLAAPRGQVRRILTLTGLIDVFSCRIPASPAR
jgi:MFS family permease